MPDRTQSNQRRTVLFVDDEPLFLEMIELLAREQGNSWEVIVASTAQRALEVLKEQAIDMAVIDLRMPVMDGLKLLEILHRLYPQLIKVVLTGFATADSKSACLKGGAHFFLQKPQSVEQIKTIFATLQELISVQPTKGFRGMLVRVDLPEVIQMECLSRHSSILEVITETLRGEVFIKDGSIIHAQTNQQQGESAFQQLLQLSGGEFKLKTFSEPPAITIHGSWEMLLMEAVRHRDETLHTRNGLAPAIQPKPPAPPNPTMTPSQNSPLPLQPVPASRRGES